MEETEARFNQALLEKYERNPKYLIPKVKYNNIIEEIKLAASLSVGRSA